MADKMNTCRVCGKQYPACRQRNIGPFHYKSVACSIECGLEYFRRVEESRKPQNEQRRKSTPRKE